jgi:hypothetical protein
MRVYAGQQLTTGAQAETSADHFIAIDLQQIGGGKTYSQLSAESQASPADAKLAATVNTVRNRETLRGLPPTPTPSARRQQSPVSRPSQRSSRLW